MNVLHFLNRFASPTLTFIYNEITELTKYCSVHVVCTKRSFPEKFPFGNVEEIPFTQSRLAKKVRHQLFKRNILLSERNRSFRQLLDKAIKEYNPDIIHCHFGIFALKLLDNIDKRFNIPIFISFHGFDASQLLKTSRVYRKRLKRLFSSKNIHPIVVSEYMYNNLTENYGLIPDEKRILYYGTDTDKFRRRKYPLNQNKMFLQLSSFREKKGHFYTIKAFHKYFRDNPNSKIELILAGDGPLLDDMRVLTNQLNMQDKITFPGLVTQKEALELMEKSNYFVHHSITSENGDSEGIPNAIMEAMAMEMPVISTYHSGIPELVEDCVNGYLVEEKDISMYARRIADIQNWDFKMENRKKIEEMFEKKKHAITLIDFYNKGSSPN